MISVQIFGIKKSSATRAAERFFKERRATVHSVDLTQKPMSPGEIRRFIERYTLAALIDSESKAWRDAGLQYMRLPDTDLLARIERHPDLLRLPFVRCANQISIGPDEAAWRQMAEKIA